MAVWTDKFSKQNITASERVANSRQSYALDRTSSSVNNGSSRSIVEKGTLENGTWREVIAERANAQIQAGYSV